jgi:glycosyltransferase involved in cell wall biosynthesis
VRVVHVNLVRPRGRPEPEALLAVWPTLGDVATAVARAGVEVTVIQSFHRPADLRRDGVLYRFVPEQALPGRPTGLSPWRLARAARDQGPDVIHVNGLDFGWHTRVLSGVGAPVLVQDHATVAGRASALTRWGLGRVAGAVFTDFDQARPFLERGLLRPETRIFAAPESSTRFTPGDRKAARAACGLHGDPAVLWVGRLQDKKDPLTVLDAVEIAARDLPGLRLWCCFHEAPMLGAVQARITGSPVLSERVRLLGRVPHAEIETLCRAADVFIAASHFEGSGYALIEALACGATPVVSAIPSFRALIGDGAVGALAPVGDAAAFARALVEVAGQPRETARRRVVEHFRRTLSFDVVGARLRGIYEDLLEDPR